MHSARFPQRSYLPRHQYDAPRKAAERAAVAMLAEWLILATIAAVALHLVGVA